MASLGLSFSSLPFRSLIPALTPACCLWSLLKLGSCMYKPTAKFKPPAESRLHSLSWPIVRKLLCFFWCHGCVRASPVVPSSLLLTSLACCSMQNLQAAQAHRKALILRWHLSTQATSEHNMLPATCLSPLSSRQQALIGGRYNALLCCPCDLSV